MKTTLLILSMVMVGAASASDEAFNPQSCLGPAITSEQVVNLIPGDRTSLWLASPGAATVGTPFHVRQRNCLDGTCGPWKYRQHGELAAALSLAGESANLTLYLGYPAAEGYSYCTSKCGDVRRNVISCGVFKMASNGAECLWYQEKVPPLVGRMTGHCLQLVAQEGHPITRETGILVRFGHAPAAGK